MASRAARGAENSPGFRASKRINTLHEHPDDFISLAVPFEEKDAAKAAGARWNSALRVWEIHRGKDLNAVAKWIPSGKPAVAAVNPKASGRVEPV